MLALTKLDGANAKSVATLGSECARVGPRRCLQNSTGRERHGSKSATMRARCMSIKRVDVQQAMREIARFMSEPNEGAWSMLKRLIRHLVGHGRLVPVISERRCVKAPRVDTDSDCAGCVLTRKSKTGTHLFHGVN